MLKIDRFQVIGLALSLLFVVFGCKKDKPEPGPADNKVDIYMAGYMTLTSFETPVYWKNEQLMDTLPTPAGFVGARPTCIAAVGNDVYVGGFAFDSHGFSTAVYWKNSHPVLLDSGFIISSVSSIAISGTDIYFSGSVTRANQQMPVYWKNDVVFYLPVTSDASLSAEGINLIGQDIYITGGGNSYWKNGELTVTNVNGSIKALGVSGSDLYYAGTTGTYPTFFATYWKNGQAVVLDEPAGAESRNSDAFAISVSGSTVYILGTGFVGSTNSFTNRYWINGKRMELDNNEFPLWATAIASAGEDVYISGSRSPGLNATDFIGCYWKNGEPVDFPSDEMNVQPLCLFVSKN